MNTPVLNTFQSSSLPDNQLPGLLNSALSSLMPVILLALTTILSFQLKNQTITTESFIGQTILLLSDPAIVMLIALSIATYTLGTATGMTIKKIMDIYGEAVKDIAMLLLIMSGAGALKQVLTDSGVSNEIATLLNGMDVHPLILGWSIACVIRVCVGSATVAGLTAAGIMMPLISRADVNPNLMVLSIGAGSLMFSHVNDAGFWLFKEYFNLSIRQTIRSWSMMETIVAVCGLIGVMLMNLFV